MRYEIKLAACLLIGAVVFLNAALSSGSPLSAVKNCPAFMVTKFRCVINSAVDGLAGLRIRRQVGPSGDQSCYKTICATDDSDVEARYA